MTCIPYPSLRFISTCPGISHNAFRYPDNQSQEIWSIEQFKKSFILLFFKRPSLRALSCHNKCFFLCICLWWWWRCWWCRWQRWHGLCCTLFKVSLSWGIHIKYKDVKYKIMTNDCRCANYKKCVKRIGTQEALIVWRLVWQNTVLWVMWCAVRYDGGRAGRACMRYGVQCRAVWDYAV